MQTSSILSYQTRKTHMADSKTCDATLCKRNINLDVRTAFTYCTTSALGLNEGH